MPLHYPAVYFSTARAHIAVSLWGQSARDSQIGEKTEGCVKSNPSGVGERFPTVLSSVLVISGDRGCENLSLTLYNTELEMITV